MSGSTRRGNGNRNVVADDLADVTPRDDAHDAEPGDSIVYQRGRGRVRHNVVRSVWEGSEYRLVFEPIPGADTYLTANEVNRNPNTVVEKPGPS